MTEIEPSTLCILNAKGQTIGTGFLVSKTLAVTCAHVAISASPDGENRIRVQFTGQKQPITAKMLDQFLDLERDVAILELDSAPEGVQPLRLGAANNSASGNPFFAFGYASAAKIQGIATRGQIITLLPDGRLLQIRSHEADHGISGAPVFDEARGVVVGMITKGHEELGRNAETTFATPAELIFEICSEIQPSEICPYLGLESFTAETERFFFGRAALTEKLLTTLRVGCRFLAVFGPSGSGKSSVVRAGLLPALAKGQLPGSQKWAQVTIRPADDPFAQMKALSLGLRDIDGYLRRQPSMERLVLFVDQFEELFTLCPDELRDGFVRDLAAALDASHLVLIISMRDDFYSAFNAKAAPLAASTDKVVVDVPITLERADLVVMIEQPAAAVGLALEEGLTDAIIKDATTDGAARSSTLPLLEFALTQLWDKRRDSLLTHDAYQSIGGVTGSLARWADDAYSALPKTDQPLAESLLTALVHLGDEAQGLPDTRRRRALAEFDEPTRRVIKHFADRRLLVTGGETVELVHDALAREWSRLQSWIKHDRENLRLREAVSDATYQWDQRGRDPGELYRGTRLLQAQEWATGHASQLNPLEQAFLQASRDFLLREHRDAVVRWASFAATGLLALLMIVLAVTGKLNPLIYRPFEMAWQPIPATAGFQMGSDAGKDDEKPAHTVSLSAFEIGRYEVTNRQYAQCTRAGICAAPANKVYNLETSALLPVTDVSWNDAQTFCSWTGGRLPTEAEWEYAARGGLPGKTYPWGDQAPNCVAGAQNGANFSDGGTCNPMGAIPVGSFAPNGYGLYDMAGNVWEWVGDWYSAGYYTTLGTKVSDPQGPATGDYRVLRGGSWNLLDDNLHSAYRVSLTPDEWYVVIGFRCART